MKQKIERLRSLMEKATVGPWRFSPWHLEEGPFGGMSLRDWFAGQALAGMQVMTLEGWTNKDIGLQAYSIADAMLAAREAPND